MQFCKSSYGTDYGTQFHIHKHGQCEKNNRHNGRYVITSCAGLVQSLCFCYFYKFFYFSAATNTAARNSNRISNANAITFLRDLTYMVRRGCCCLRLGILFTSKVSNLNRKPVYQVLVLCFFLISVLVVAVSFFPFCTPTHWRC